MLVVSRGLFRSLCRCICHSYLQTLCAFSSLFGVCSSLWSSVILQCASFWRHEGLSSSWGDVSLCELVAADHAQPCLSRRWHSCRARTRCHTSQVTREEWSCVRGQCQFSQRSHLPHYLSWLGLPLLASWIEQKFWRLLCQKTPPTDSQVGSRWWKPAVPWASQSSPFCRSGIYAFWAQSRTATCEASRASSWEFRSWPRRRGHCFQNPSRGRF